MMRLARLSIRRPRAALTFWAIFAVVLALLGLGVSDSLSPSISVVPGSESSRAQALSESEFGPSVLVPILLEGSPAQLDRQGPKLVVELGKRDDARVMSAWSRGDVGRALRPRPDAAMIVVSVARTEKQMVETVQPQIERTVGRVVTGQVSASITGQPTLDRAIEHESIATTRQTELIAVGILFVLLLIGLRTPVAAFILSAFGAVTTLVGFGAMALLGQVVETDPLAVALASITGLALGVGFSLMIVDRFREEELASPPPAGGDHRARGPHLRHRADRRADRRDRDRAHADPHLDRHRRAALLGARHRRRRRGDARRADTAGRPHRRVLVPRAALPGARLGLGRRPRSLGHPLRRRRRCGRDRPAGGARGAGHRPRDRAARREHAARLLTGARELRARQHGHGPGLADAVQRRGRLEDSSRSRHRRCCRRSRPSRPSWRATSASTRSSVRARSWPRART